MLQKLTRWFSAKASGASAALGLMAWAETRGYSLRRVRDSEGFVIDGQQGAIAWRLEWGPSQRNYISGPELRIRCELPLRKDLHALVLNRRLMESLERNVFDQYVEGVQTRIDDQTPPEMRWLVMFPQLGNGELGSLRERYGAVGSNKVWLLQWLAGPLSTALGTVPEAEGQPWVLMLGRGRLSLRTALALPTSQAIEAQLRCFETALREARRVTVEDADHHVASTQPSMFQPSTLVR